MYAVLGNYPECVSILLDNGAQLGLADTSGRGALHWAAHHGRGACAKLLVRAGAGRECWAGADQGGVTVLHLAMRHDKVVVMLYYCLCLVESWLNISDSAADDPEKVYLIQG